MVLAADNLGALLYGGLVRWSLWIVPDLWLLRGGRAMCGLVGGVGGYLCCWT